MTKRVIGVGGDSVRVFGEYAREYHGAAAKEEEDGGGDDDDGGDWDSCGVPRVARYPLPFCQRVALSQSEKAGTDVSKHECTVTLPPKHVWVEGDNPLFSNDSRHFGPLPESALRGRVTMRLWPIEPGTALLSSKRPVPPMNRPVP